jgi:mycothiol synthase
MDDVDAAFALVREVQTADYGAPQFTREDMGVAWRLTDLRNVWLVENEEGEMVAFGAIRPRHPTRLRTFAGVAPAHRSRGVGSFLLGLIEERSRELAAEAPAGEAIMIGQDVGELNTDAGPLLERFSYRLARKFWQMGIDLTNEPPEPEVPEGIVIGPMREGTEREIFDTSEEAFRDHWDHVPHDYDEWRAWMVERPSFDPSLWLVAYEGEQIAGSSLNFVEPDEAWVGVLSVLRPWRRRGLGLALLHASFREFRRRGIPKAMLGVDAENITGATRLYERAGMHVVRESSVYWKEVSRV